MFIQLPDLLSQLLDVIRFVYDVGIHLEDTDTYIISNFSV